jgi:uncharacterized protein (TIGR02145 family)
MKKALLILVILSFCISCKKDNLKNDRYKSVTIGSQVWMQSNLDVDHYRNGDPIPEVKNLVEWHKLTTGAWCYFNNNYKNGIIYGKLYNWYAVNDSRGLAPVGWHIPSDIEWETLIEFLGGEKIAGGKMKEKGFSHWNYPNEGATNSSSFSGLPGGELSYYGQFSGLGVYCEMWSSTERSKNLSHSRTLGFNYTYLVNLTPGKDYGLSVRCIKDK